MPKSFSANLAIIGTRAVFVASFLVCFAESAKHLFAVYLHRLIVAVRETSGLAPFEVLPRCPRHVCLAIGRPSSVADVERAVRTMLSAGVERVTVAHDGSLLISSGTFTESVTADMGRSQLVNSIRPGGRQEEVSHPDAILMLGSGACNTRFSNGTIQIPKSVDAALIYYSELIPVYSLHPSDVFLAVSMFHSKSQRFGR